MSQDLDLKLSQETMDILYNEIQMAANQISMPFTTLLESPDPGTNPPPVYTAPSHLEIPPFVPGGSGDQLAAAPAFPVKVEKELGLTQWSGVYGFDLKFSEQQRYKKNHPVCFSSLKNTLIVKDGVGIPFTFTASTPIKDLQVKVFAVFSSPQFFLTPVKPCHNHYTEATPEFLVCGNLSSSPCSDEYGRQGILIPLSSCRDDLGTGMELEEILTFTCRTSCTVPNSPNGINNRPLSLIFLLETPDGLVVGRRAVSLKVAVSPGRDMSTLQKDRKRNRSEASTSAGSTGGSFSERPPKKVKMIPGTARYQLVLYCSKRARKLMQALGNGTDRKARSTMPEGVDWRRIMGNEPASQESVATQGNGSQPDHYTLEGWLQRYGLEQYAETLERHGFGMPGRFSQVDEEDLDQLGIVDPCHRMTLVHASTRVLMRGLELPKS